MSVWCVVCYDSDGGHDDPRFFNTKGKATDYIHQAVLASADEYFEVKETYNDTVLRAKMWNDEFSVNWEGFDVTENIKNVLNTEAQL